jgi:hypothetical protein
MRAREMRESKQGVLQAIDEINIQNQSGSVKETVKEREIPPGGHI